MKITVINNDGKTYAYEENFWTGRKELAVNGIKAYKITKKSFVLNDSSRATITVKGNFLTGIKLIQDNGIEIILCQNKWYEWLLIFLPFLYFGLGIFGGGIGGGLSALFALIAATLNATVLRTKQNTIAKILICIAVFVIMFAVWFGIYLILVGGLAIAFPALFA